MLKPVVKLEVEVAGRRCAAMQGDSGRGHSMQLPHPSSEVRLPSSMHPNTSDQPLFTGPPRIEFATSISDQGARVPGMGGSHGYLEGFPEGGAMPGPVGSPLP